MAEIIHSMQYALAMAGGNVGFTALFLAGLFALWNNKFEHRAETGQLFWYALLTLTVIINPFYLLLVMRFMPEAQVDNMYLWILPTTPVIVYVGVRAIGYGKGVWNRIILALGMVAILLLAAFTSYDQNKWQWTENNAYIPPEEYEIICQIENYRSEMRMDTVLLWGEQDVMKDARVYTGQIYTIYGKDLWMGSTDSQMHQIYEDWQYRAYEAMQSPWANMELIGEIALDTDCDVLVFDAKKLAENDFELADVIFGQYYLYYIDDNYYMYTK